MCALAMPHARSVSFQNRENATPFLRSFMKLIREFSKGGDADSLAWSAPVMCIQTDAQKRIS